MPSQGIRELQIAVNDLLANKRAGPARNLVASRLEKTPAGNKRLQQNLLNVMLSIELYLQRPGPALELLAKIRSMGFASIPDSFDATLGIASLLASKRKWFSARAELTQLLSDARCTRWPGILDALKIYVDVEEACSKQMDYRVRRAYSGALKQFGFSSPVPTDDNDLQQSIKVAHSDFRVSSSRHTQCILAVLSANTEDARSRVAVQLRNNLKMETVGFFRDQGKDLLKHLERKTRKSIIKRSTDPKQHGPSK